MAVESIQMGAGVLVLKDSNNNAYQCGTLQDVSIEFGSSTKELRGANQFAEAIAIVDRKVSIKAKLGKVNGALVAAICGGTTTAGAAYIQTDSKTFATSVTITPPASGTFATDLGVKDANGQPMKYNSGTVAVGEYKNTAGVYTFAAGQSGTGQVSYVYTVSTGETVAMTNQLQGLVTPFTVYAYNAFTNPDGAVRKLCFKFYSAVSGSINFPMKAGDFLMQDISLECSADSTGKVADVYFG